MGSFYMVVGDRLSNNLSIVSPRSHCTNCKHTLSWYELIPVLSYVFLGGKCKSCKTKLSVFYPLMEVLTGCLFCLCFYFYGFSYNTLIGIVISSLLVIIFVSDFLYLIILDEPLLVCIILSIFLNFISYGFKIGLYYLFSGFIIFLIFYLIKFIGDRVFKRESLGGGDIKYSFFMGLVLGAKYALVALFIASLIALPYALFYVIRNKEKEIPFGPFLAMGTLLTFIFLSPIKEFIDYLFMI